MVHWRKVLGVQSGRAGAGTRARLLLAVSCLVVVGSASVGVWQLWWSPLSKPNTIAEAYELLGGSLRLDSTRYDSWQYAVHHGVGLEARTDTLVMPLPPILCAGDLAIRQNAQRLGQVGTDFDQSLIQAERAVSDDQPRLSDVSDAIRSLQQAEVQIRTAVDNLSGQVPYSLPVWALERQMNRRVSDVARYSLARITASRDLARAARLLDSVALTSSSGGPLPVVRASEARRRRPQSLVTLAYYSRYLAGYVAYKRDNTVQAVDHFKRTLNALNYYPTSALGGVATVIGRQSGSTSVAVSHYERLSVRLGILSCGTGRDLSLTSLDAYAGLVTAYMASSDYTGPPGALAGEVARGDNQIERDDPLWPLIKYAQEHAHRVGRTGGLIPENILWAASNVQRVYQYNRFDPDPRFAIARAHLTLRSINEWSEVLGIENDKRCEMLTETLSGIRQGGTIVGPAGSAQARIDSLRAAVAVHVTAKLEDECPGATDVDDTTGTRWMSLAGNRLEPVGKYERWRQQLAGPMRMEVDSIRDILERAEDDADTADAYSNQWLQAVFRDLTVELLEHVGNGAVARGRAGDVSRYVDVLDAAVVHSGRHLADGYRWEDLEPLTQSLEWWDSSVRWFRYHARSSPWIVAIFLAGLTLFGLVLVLWVFVNCWRFHLLIRRDFYGEEKAEQQRKLGASEGLSAHAQPPESVAAHRTHDV